MTIHELFEQHYAEQTGTEPYLIRYKLMCNGSYGEAHIATAFRYFKAGFEANQPVKLQFLGYLSRKGVHSASQGRAAFFYTRRTPNATEAVYVKQYDDHKTGDEA
jgi:hypothetical protein